MRGFLLAIAMFLWAPVTLASPPQELTVPTYDDNLHKFYHDLLRQSMMAQGHEVVINEAPPMPQKRIVQELHAGRLSIFWMVRSKERDQTFVAVNGGLTNGLIGNRILFVKRGNEEMFANVKTLDDFRNSKKVGGLGAAWFDVKIWAANQLDYEPVDGDWTSIYPMLSAGNRGIDYFSRGAHEILAERDQHLYLSIEPHLVLVYENDMGFYLPPTKGALKPTLEVALAEAKKSGLISDLVRVHFKDVFEQLKVDTRTRIELKLPD